MSISTSSKATLAIGLAALCWGLWWIPVRWLAQQGLTGNLVSVAIFPIAATALAPVALSRTRLSSRDIILLFQIGMLMGATLALTNAALLTGNVARVLLLFYLAPVWATLFNFMIIKVSLGKSRLGSLLLGLGGAYCVLHTDATWLPLPASQGEWMGLLAGMSFAGGSVYIRQAELIGSRVHDPLLQTFYTFMFAGILGLFFYLFISPVSPFNAAQVMHSLPLAFLVAIFWLIPQMWLFMWGSSRLDTTKVAILMLAEPMVAVISASILLDEALSGWEITGCLLIITGGLIESIRPQHAQKNA